MGGSVSFGPLHSELFPLCKPFLLGRHRSSDCLAPGVWGEEISIDIDLVAM